MLKEKSMIKISGNWWNGRESNNKFKMDNVFISNFKEIYKIIKKNQALEFNCELYKVEDDCIVSTNKNYFIKKDAGAYKFYIKKNNKFNYIKTKELIKMFIEKV
jgi:hypothetical protein